MVFDVKNVGNEGYNRWKKEKKKGKSKELKKKIEKNKSANKYLSNSNSNKNISLEKKYINIFTKKRKRYS